MTRQPIGTDNLKDLKPEVVLLFIPGQDPSLNPELVEVVIVNKGSVVTVRKLSSQQEVKVLPSELYFLTDEEVAEYADKYNP